VRDTVDYNIATINGSNCELLLGFDVFGICNEQITGLSTKRRDDTSCSYRLFHPMYSGRTAGLRVQGGELSLVHVLDDLRPSYDAEVILSADGHKNR
jgi:hypothetical protein